MAHFSDADLLADLRSQLPEIQRYRGTMDTHEKLTVEAYDCAVHGDFDEARHRLRLRDRPKFQDEADCYLRYTEAMVETRAARAAQ